MDGLCFLCLCCVEPGALPICADCAAQLDSLPIEKRMAICQKLFLVDSQRRLSRSISDVSDGLQTLIRLSATGSAYYRN